MSDNYAKIIAVDFDGCLVTNKYPDIGEPIPATIAALKSEQSEGARVILWTFRTGALLDDAENWCHSHGIHPDVVNQNIPEMIAFFEGDTRKIFANEYWDDRARVIPGQSTEVARLRAENKVLRRERDAAVADIDIECYTCKHYKREFGQCVEVGHGLCLPKGRYSGWQWRGVAPESEG